MAKILFVASEAAPFIKSGGLADVMGALPRELRALGVETALVIPKYSAMAPQYTEQLETVYEGTVDLAWRNKYFGVQKLNLDGIDVYFIDNEWYFKRDTLYGWGDDDERFAFFAKAVLAMLPHIGFKPELLHCNDWHTGMVPVYLKEQFAQDNFYQGIKTVYTVHNLKYQGIFPPTIVSDVLGLPNYLFDNGNIECDGCVNYMKSGLVYADYVTTVSPSYAQEITYPYYGERLDGYVRTIQGKLRGIINGLDEKAYNPETDPYIAAQYTPENLTLSKQKNKEDLQRTLGLPLNPRVPVIAMVTRLVEDKGMDLVTYIMDELLQEDVQFVILGTGDAAYEDAMRGLAQRNPAKASVNIRFSEELAHKIYAGADIFVMPSRFEACGLSQLIAMKYGTIPVVRECGGLRDTVIPFDKVTGQGNGLRFTNFNAHELLFTIKRALTYFYEGSLWNRLVSNAATSDYSWRRSAEAYRDVYSEVLGYDAAVLPEPSAEETVVSDTEMKEECGEENSAEENVAEAAESSDEKICAEKSETKIISEGKNFAEEEIKDKAPEAAADKIEVPDAASEMLNETQPTQIEIGGTQSGKIETDAKILADAAKQTTKKRSRRKKEDAAKDDRETTKPAVKKRASRKKITENAKAEAKAPTKKRASRAKKTSGETSEK